MTRLTTGSCLRPDGIQVLPSQASIDIYPPLGCDSSKELNYCNLSFYIGAHLRTRSTISALMLGFAGIPLSHTRNFYYCNGQLGALTCPCFWHFVVQIQYILPGLVQCGNAYIRLVVKTPFASKYSGLGANHACTCLLKGMHAKTKRTMRSVPVG